MSQYTWYIVTRSRNEHYPVLVANNGKIPFNEVVNHASVLERGLKRLDQAHYTGDVAIVRISEVDFRKKFPKFAKNAGPKKKAAPKAPAPKPDKPARLFAKGNKVKVDAGVWGTVRALVLGYGKNGLVRLLITHGKHKGHEGYWGEECISLISK